MNVQPATITMPHDQAQRLYWQYRRAIESDTATREDRTLFAALRKVLKGERLIDINLAIGLGGLDGLGRPRLAIARTDWPFVVLASVRHEAGERYRFTSRTGPWERKPKGEVDVPATAFGPRPSNIPGPLDVRGTPRAQVPPIPPAHRPSRGLPSDYHLLFEAVWHPAPTGDPMLLQHVDGPFFVVLAAWDLTILEQAVLRARL